MKHIKKDVLHIQIREILTHRSVTRQIILNSPQAAVVSICLHVIVMQEF